MKKVRWALRVVAVLVSLIAFGCSDERQVAALQKKTDDLEAEVKKLKESVEHVESEQSWDKLMRDVGGTAYSHPERQVILS